MGDLDDVGEWSIVGTADSGKGPVVDGSHLGTQEQVGNWSLVSLSAYLECFEGWYGNVVVIGLARVLAFVSAEVSSLG